MQDPIKHIRQNYSKCIAQSCREKACELRLDGVDPALLAVVHGTKYQKHNNFAEKLCDGILFYKEAGLVLAAVELKGGKNVNMSHARKQIQNGLIVAKTILESCSVTAVTEWFPLLMYSGHMGNHETKFLLMNPVNFQGDPKLIMRRDCGTHLYDATQLP